MMVDASAVPEMHDAHYDDDTNSLSVGAAVSLNRLAALLRQHDDSGGRAPAGFPYGQSVFGMLASHLKKIAGEQVMKEMDRRVMVDGCTSAAWMMTIFSSIHPSTLPPTTPPNHH